LSESLDRPLYNRVMRGLYPPGSTIKPMVVVAGLDAKAITPETKVFDPGYYQLPNVSHKYRNWNRYGDGWVDLELAIARSNDTYFYDLAHKLGIDQLHHYMTRFGFGTRVALDVFEETAGLMPSREWKQRRYRQVWYPGETLILGIGQGYMQATALQLGQATALMAPRGQGVRQRLSGALGGRRAACGSRSGAGHRAAGSQLLGSRHPRHGVGGARPARHGPAHRPELPLPDRRQKRHGPGGGHQAGRDLRQREAGRAAPRPRPVRCLRTGGQPEDRRGGDGRERRIGQRLGRAGGPPGDGCLAAGRAGPAQAGIRCTAGREGGEPWQLNSIAPCPITIR